MNFDPTQPPTRNLDYYAKQAEALVQAFKSSRSEALRLIRRYHPRLPGRPNTNDRNKIQESQICQTGLKLADARVVMARAHQFETWTDFSQHLRALNNRRSQISRFENAVDAIVAGRLSTLKRLLRENPELIRFRSTREHRATLLHYVGANAVERYRQKTPKNAVKVAELLLDAGAEADADLDYGANRQIYPERTGSTTLGLVATSCHPAEAGVQVPLIDVLLQHGASVDGLPGGWSPLLAALHNGRGVAAAHLAKCGARLDLEGAAGVGRLAAVKRFFHGEGGLKANATQAQMEAGMMWACQYGRANVVEFLLKSGINVAAQPHGETGLHWAAYAGQTRVVKALLAREAPVDAKDRRFGGTPLGWALYGWCNPPLESDPSDYYEVVARLVTAKALVPREWLDESERGLPMLKRIRSDRQMLSAIGGEAFLR